jgi:monovalent cation/hydrogen antiporter
MEENFYEQFESQTSRHMSELEQLLALFVAAVILAALALADLLRYSSRSAVRCSRLCRVPSFTVPPELALALFVAPVLPDEEFDPV